MQKNHQYSVHSREELKMNKLMVLVFPLFVLTVGLGTVKAVNPFNDGVEVHRILQQNTIKAFDGQLGNFNQLYKDQFDVLDFQQRAIIKKTESKYVRLTELSLLSPLSDECVSKYKYSADTVENVKVAVNNCISKAASSVEQLLSTAAAIRDQLNSYFVENFENEVHKCKVGKDVGLCILNIVEQDADYTFNKENEFEYALDIAHCNAELYNKRVLECISDVEDTTVKKIAEFEYLVSNCQLGKDVCEPCGNNTCSEVIDYTPDYNSVSVPNPFYNNTNHRGCIMLQLN